MGKRIYKQSIKKVDEGGVVVTTYVDAIDAGEHENVTPSTIYRLIKEKRLLRGFSFEYGDKLPVREKYKNVKPYFILVEDCSDQKNPNVWDLRTCPICGKQFYVRKRYKRVVCSDECHEKYMLLNREKINNNRRLKCKEKYNLKTKETIQAEHEKAKKTCMERYGYESAQQTPEYRARISKILKEKDWSERNKLNFEKLYPKYKEICDKDNLELIEFRNRFDCTVKCKKCGNIFVTHTLGYLSEQTAHNICRKCYPNKNTLKITEPFKKIEKILINNNINYQKNVRTIIPPYEIDLYIPDLRLGIEINGNYWHSEIGGNRDKNYHIRKTELCFKKGIKLIQIFEDEIVNKFDIVESRLLNNLSLTNNKIFARKCCCEKITNKEKKAFLETNHIDGDSISSYNIGLRYDGELVSVATFCKRKISGKEQYELIRFASKLNTLVVGGFDKLLTFFKKNNPTIDILITYADIRWSGVEHENNVYQRCGFTYIGKTEPNYYYVDKDNYLKRINRLNFTKQKLIKMGYDKNLTEEQIMLNNGYDRIWNCGSMKFEYKF